MFWGFSPVRVESHTGGMGGVNARNKPGESKEAEIRSRVPEPRVFSYAGPRR